MQGKRWIGWSILLGLMPIAGCSWWCDRLCCHERTGYVASPACCPAPVCCTPTPCPPAPAGYAPVAPAGWQRAPQDCCR
jgi:hypothetical protein